MKNYIISMVLFVGVMALFLVGVDNMSKTAANEGADTLENAIQRASIQCYAIEGRYPPSVDYLVANYGIQIDDTKYIIDYNGFASNVIPDITVIRKDKGR